MSYLESLLSEHEIKYAASQEFDLGAKKTVHEHPNSSNEIAERSMASSNATIRGETGGAGQLREDWEQQQDEADKLNKLVSNIGMVSVKGASDPRYLGSTSGISFARVVFAAVKSSVSSASSERGGNRVNKSKLVEPLSTNSTSMRDSFFGLHTRPTIKQAPFPDKLLGLSLVELYFEHANPQIPILHRGEFMTLFDRAYASKDRRRSPRELYMLNIVFAIGAGIILEDSSAGRSPGSTASMSPTKHGPASPNSKKRKSGLQRQPEEYHASAMMHLESCLGSGPSSDRPEGLGGGLEELQAVLLLAGFALLRPVAPGLWYITGVAVRLGIDLGLHYEDRTGVDGSSDIIGLGKNAGVAMEAAGNLSDSHRVDEKERGRREWVRDLRRRLWWCVYSFDRLVSTCVGRPFGITDQVITAEFPSILDDTNIKPSGFSMPSDNYTGPSYKRVSHHYFRLRLLQSEILQVLQYRQAQKAHASATTHKNEYMHTKLPSPFLQGFESFHAWRRDIDRRLWDWKESAPLQQDTTVQFSVKFLELNYWQAVIMLYRQSLSVPPPLAGEVSPSEDVSSPMSFSTDDHEDEDEIFLKVAEAGQRVLKLYRQLHRVHLVNYTYLATVHLFMAGTSFPRGPGHGLTCVLGIAFLYAVWHSTTVRSRLVSRIGVLYDPSNRVQTLDDVDFTVLAATSVLGDLIDKCPPAEACRDAFDRMSKATVKMCLSTTGFGSRFPPFDSRPNHEDHVSQPSPFDISDFSSQHHFGGTSRPPVQFDLNLRDLFPEETQDGRSFGSNLGRWQTLPRSNMSTEAASLPRVPPDGLNPSIALQPNTIDPIHAMGHAAMDPGTNGLTYDMYGFANSNEVDFSSNNHDDHDSAAMIYGDSGLGLGIDEGHQWGHGTQLDLFDGFFFGSVGNSACDSR